MPPPPSIYSAVAAAAWRREAELSALAIAAGSALTAVALAQFLDGPALVVAWAAETAMLAWLGRRLADSRFQLLALAYLDPRDCVHARCSRPSPICSSRGSATTWPACPRCSPSRPEPRSTGWLARSWPPPRGLDAMPSFVRELVEDLHAQRRVLSLGSLALAGVLAVDAASLSLLELFDWMNIEPAFDWGHVAVTGLWSLVALVLLAIGVRGSQLLEVGGLAVLGGTIAAFATFTVAELDHVSGWSALILAGACISAALLHGLLASRPLPVDSRGRRRVQRALVRLSPPTSCSRRIDSATGCSLRRRLISSWLPRSGASGSSRRPSGSRAPSSSAVASVDLLDGTWLVLALAGGAIAAAVLGRLLAEPRLWLASTALTVIAGAYTLDELAQPGDFVHASSLPAEGVPALLLVGAALAALLLSLRRFEARDELDRWIDDSVEAAKRALVWTLAVLGLYAASLAILGAAEALSTAGEKTEFQRGHTAVSAFWGIVAFTALLIGLRRGLQVLRLAALGLFALALGKLFLYDLSTLSSVSRALSFLAVGAVLLLAGFFYQRLSSSEVAPS